MNIQDNPILRKGQRLFNFLEWLHLKKGYPTYNAERMADPFHVDDDVLEGLWKEYADENIGIFKLDGTSKIQPKNYAPNFIGEGWYEKIKRKINEQKRK